MQAPKLLTRPLILVKQSRPLSTSRFLNGKTDPNLVLSSTVNNVTTLVMNDPKKLNGWTEPMMLTLQQRFQEHATDPDTKVLILTGADPYYCAGVNLSAAIRPMMPKKLHNMIVVNNQAVFDSFFDFPKPILIAANGPAIGACVTSASTCDAILASERATFLTPFARLGVTPEGCSSIHFEKVFGAVTANRLLGPEGWQPTAEEAKEIGLVMEVVPHERLLARAQEIGEQWVKEGRVKQIPGGGDIQHYKAVNAKESEDLADAFLSYKFLDAQYNFLKSKGKNATPFLILKTLRPLWSKLL